jgi:predicted Zn-dependent protease with MMP-like domain
MSADEFESAVTDALNRIPDRTARTMDNVAVFIEDDFVPGPGEDPETVLLGLYEGVPLTERDPWWDAGSLPDRVTIFRQPILEICESREEVS